MSPSDCVMCWVDNNGVAWAADYTNADDTAPSTFTGSVRCTVWLKAGNTRNTDPFHLLTKAAKLILPPLCRTSTALSLLHR